MSSTATPTADPGGTSSATADTGKDSLDQLKSVQAAITEGVADHALEQTLVNPAADGQFPFLSVAPPLSSAGTFDPFLVDAAPLRMCVSFAEDPETESVRLTAFLFSACSREVVREVQLTEDKAEMKAQLTPLLEIVAKGAAAAAHCTGFDVAALDDVFSRIRKTDLPHLLIERYDGRLLFRARMCRYVIVSGDEEEAEAEAEKVEGWSDRVPGKHCVECVKVFKDLDSKYTYGRFTDPKKVAEEKVKTEEAEFDVFQEPKQVTVTPVKVAAASNAEEDDSDKPARKRGRPKGSKNRSYLYGADYINPDVAIKPKSDEDEENKPQNKSVDTDDTEEGEEDAEDKEAGLGMVDDPEDQDFTVNLRKSNRKRKLSRKVIQDLSRPRKRGRPPIITDPVSCKECGKVFTVLKEYKEHCLTHTNNFACDFEDCNKRFRIEFDLEVHKRRHRGENPFVCTECDQNFASRGDLKAHVRKHKGNRPFPCNLCPKTFAREQQRKIHMVTHTGEKPCLCPECGNSFGSFSTLIDHRKRKHLQMREHKCGDCTKGFFTRQELEAHTRTHTGDKPFLCTECGKGFSRTHHLKRHIESVHKGIKMKQAFARRKVTVHSAAGPADLADGTVSLGSGVFKLEEGIDGETVLVTTEDDTAGAVLVRDIQEYVVEGQPNVKYTTTLADDGTPILVEKISPEDALAATSSASTSGEQQQQLQYTTLSGATSLIELSRMGGKVPLAGEEGGQTFVVQEEGETTTTVVMEDDGIVGGAGYLLVTTGDNEQKLVPVSAATPAELEQAQAGEGRLITVQEDEEPGEEETVVNVAT